MAKVLLIGGTDPSGAGLQTDWCVTNTLEVEAVSIVTAVTAQNNSAVLYDGVLPYAQIKAQLDALGKQQFSAIKIGMLGNEGVIKAISSYLAKQPSETVVILDPILASSSGSKLLNYAGQRVLLKKLMPYVTLLTPNTNELATLTGKKINNFQDLEACAHDLLDSGAKSILVKGGHFHVDENNQDKCIDTFISPGGAFFLEGYRWEGKKNVRGTGCVLSSAIASFINQSYNLIDSLILSKALVSQGIKNSVAVDNEADINKAVSKFKFTKQYSGRNFSLEHLPRLKLSTRESYYNFSPCDLPNSESGNKSLGIYPVVDSVDWVKKLVPLGIKTIQLRVKDKTPEEVEAEILEAIQFCKDFEIRLFINDYWQLAIEHEAYGIHLGQEDLATADLEAIANSGCRLGISTHSYTEVARTIDIKPSYLALGPIYATTSKDMPWIPQGAEAVENWVKLLGDDYPLVAIGGINIERAKRLKQTGVGSVAMISAITESRDYEKTTKELLDIWKGQDSL